MIPIDLSYLPSLPLRFITLYRLTINNQDLAKLECGQTEGKKNKRKKKQIQKDSSHGSVLTATDDCGCVGGVRQLDPRDHGARRESQQVRWPVQPRAWTQVSQKSTYVEGSHETPLKISPRVVLTVVIEIREVAKSPLDSGWSRHAASVMIPYLSLYHTITAIHN